MTRDEIKNIIPHREPMLLLDTLDVSQDSCCVGTYKVKGDEFFLQGHFPGNPVVPGVILCEMMGQSACLLVKTNGGNFTPYFTGMNNVRFKNKVFPGDEIILKTEKTNQKGAFYFIKSSAYVGEKLCASGEFSFAVVSD